MFRRGFGFAKISLHAVPPVRGRKAVFANPRAENLYRELIRVGDRVLEALEVQLENPDPSSVSEEDLLQWISAREALEGLMKEYLATLQTWRESLMEGPFE